MTAGGLTVSGACKVTTNSRHDYPVAPNLLNRAFNPSAANIAWAPDITYIRTGEGWLYLATVIDLYSRRIIGLSLSNRLKKQWVIIEVFYNRRRRHSTLGYQTPVHYEMAA